MIYEELGANMLNTKDINFPDLIKKNKKQNRTGSAI